MSSFIQSAARIESGVAYLHSYALTRCVLAELPAGARLDYGRHFSSVARISGARAYIRAFALRAHSALMGWSCVVSDSFPSGETEKQKRRRGATFLLLLLRMVQKRR